jgi:hypothetical protein
MTELARNIHALKELLRVAGETLQTRNSPHSSAAKRATKSTSTAPNCGVIFS